MSRYRHEIDNARAHIVSLWLVNQFERRVIRATLLRHGWNKSRSAAELGLSRLGLRR